MYAEVKIAYSCKITPLVLHGEVLACLSSTASPNVIRGFRWAGRLGPIKGKREIAVGKVERNKIFVRHNA